MKWRTTKTGPALPAGEPAKERRLAMATKAKTPKVTTKIVKMTGTGAKAAQFAHKNVEGVGIWNLSVLIVPDGDFWFAQSLEINYGAQGDSPEEAQENFQAGLLATICQHLRMHGNIERLLKFAPSNILVEAAKNKARIKRFSQVSIHEIAGGPVQQALPFDGIDYRVLQAAA